MKDFRVELAKELHTQAGNKLADAPLWPHNSCFLKRTFQYEELHVASHIDATFAKLKRKEERLFGTAESVSISYATMGKKRLLP